MDEVAVAHRPVGEWACAAAGGRPRTARHLASTSVTVLDQLGAPDLRAAVHAYKEALAAHREPINRLNVYPVPDGDTGTNMSLTLASVCDDLDAAGEGLSEVCRAISHGSLMGARGNSGVILSQILRGLVSVIDDAGSCDGPTFARALRAASDAAYQAVMRPVEGTILTVVRESAEAAERAVAEAPASPTTETRPRRICDKMTPELPRAPMSDPWLIAVQTSARLSPAASTSSHTDPSVSDMLVPVSPSGTGYTLSRLIGSRCAASASL